LSDCCWRSRRWKTRSSKRRGSGFSTRSTRTTFCVSSARTDPCGGWEAPRIPSAAPFHTSYRPRLGWSAAVVPLLTAPTACGRPASILLLRPRHPPSAAAHRRCCCGQRRTRCRSWQELCQNRRCAAFPSAGVSHCRAHPFETLSRFVQRNSKSTDRGCCRGSSRTFPEDWTRPLDVVSFDRLPSVHHPSALGVSATPVAWGLLGTREPLRLQSCQSL